MALTEQQARKAAERVMGLRVEPRGDFPGHAGISNGFTCVADVYDSKDAPASEIAKLFVSAPFMLAALLDLQGMEHHITDPGLRAKFVDRVYSAIEKALK